MPELTRAEIDGVLAILRNRLPAYREAAQKARERVVMADRLGIDTSRAERDLRWAEKALAWCIREIERYEKM